MFAASMNSGLFDGVGMDITSDGGKFTVGALEMSNVDLSHRVYADDHDTAWFPS